MNKELLDKLKFQAAAQVSPLLEGSEWQRVFTEKFAELIVKECIQVVDDTMTENQEMNIGLVMASAAIVSHFGVEE